LWLGWFLVIAGWLGQPFLTTGAGQPGFRIASQFLTPLGLIFGAALVLGGYACTLWCYQAMGNAWRIGINPKEKNLLVTAGPYRAVRHPIYLFQIVMLAGVLLLLPTVCSLALLLIHLACVLVKSSDEEAYLRGVHGKAYEEYVARTGRLFPWFG
jgi:protein-S-isoprenylcysteine O-methyltransferase Ste14